MKAQNSCGCDKEVKVVYSRNVSERDLDVEVVEGMGFIRKRTWYCWRIQRPTMIINNKKLYIVAFSSTLLLFRRRTSEEKQGPRT